MGRGVCGQKLKKLNFDLLTPRVRGEGACEQNICYLVATFCDSNKFDMQHDHILNRERSGSVLECMTRDRAAVVQASPESLCCGP